MKADLRTEGEPRTRGSGGGRLHAALMPDYNRRTTAYWWLIVLIGTAVLAHALRSLSELPLFDLAQVGAGAAIAMVAGFFPFRVRALEELVHRGRGLHLPAAPAARPGGGDVRGCRRGAGRFVANVEALDEPHHQPGDGEHRDVLERLAAACRDGLPALVRPGSAAVLLVATSCCALLYFLLNTVLITAVPYLKRSKWPTLGETFASFGWVGISFAGSASVACLLFLTLQYAASGW